MHPLEFLPDDLTYPAIDIDDIEDIYEQVPLNSTYAHLAPPITRSPEPALEAQLPDKESADHYIYQCTICASQAEVALQRATKSTTPILCWGCGSPDHRWYNCPQRGQPEAIARARKQMTEFMTAKKGKREDSDDQKPPPSTYKSRAAALRVKWEEEGHPSLEVAQIMVTLCDPDTDPSLRASAYISLATQLQASQPPKTQAATLPTKPVRVNLIVFG